MAKICNVCNKSYPDDLAVCPHCSSAVDLGLPPEEGGSGEAPVVRLEGAGASISRQGMTGSDSEIDLGEPSAAPRQAEPISGASSTAWASLVEQKPPDDEGPGQLEFDSPSAQDLRGPSVPKPPPPGTEGEEAVVFEADDLIGSSGALKRGDTSDSGNILADSSGPPSGASMVRWDSLVQDQPREPLGTEAEIRIDSPSDADLLRYAPPPAPEEELSGVGLGPPSDVSLRPPRQLEEAARADLGAEASIEPPVIDLTDEVFAAGTSDINLDSGRSATGADLGPKTPLPEPEAVGTGATQLPDISGSAVNLGERPSGRDRIAEAVESGVDLDQLDVDVSPSGAGASVDSSAVDLGGPFRAGTSGGEPSSGAVAAELLEMDENAETRRSVEARPAPETPREGRGQDEGSGLTEAGSISGPTIEGRAAREEIAEEGAEEPTEFEEAAPEAASRKEKVAGRPIGAWLGGGAVGAAVGVGACVLLWLVGLVPSGSAPPGRSDQPQPPAVPP
ncbi:MAG TPA: hypothetical protein VNK04_06455, partial [Gemmataceae bacterium]|nr:hypothetical protein [Gemmataceae bacterium]